VGSHASLRGALQVSLLELSEEGGLAEAEKDQNHEADISVLLHFYWPQRGLAKAQMNNAQKARD